jgi:hypothetical protein
MKHLGGLTSGGDAPGMNAANPGGDKGGAIAGAYLQLVSTLKWEEIVEARRLFQRDARSNT